jgi:hypothetical protein
MRMYLPSAAIGFVLLGFVLLVGAGGCASPAEAEAQTGLAAFQACDLRAASEAFDTAYTLDSSRADFALAYALSTLAILPEDPAVTAVLMRLGFTSGIDTSIFWGSGGVFDQLNSHTATCQSISDYITARFPYAAVRQNGPSAASLVRDPTLNGDDLVAAAAALDPRLEKIVSALEQAAGAESDVDIEGGCGVGKVHVESAELYGLAAFLEMFRASIEVAQGYDWAVPATLVLDTSGQEQEYADALNAQILHLQNAAVVQSAAGTALHAVELFESGLSAASKIKSRPDNSLFDWTKMPAGVLTDLQTLADFTKQMVSTPGLQALPFFSPALMMDGRSFFDMPVDMTGVNPPIWSTVTSSDGNGNSSVDLESSATGADALLAPRFSPDPFASGAPSYSLTLSQRWSNISSDTWHSVFDPDERWEDVYGCSN